MGPVFKITKKVAHIIIPLKVGLHCNSHECGLNVLTFKGGYHGIISKGAFHVYKHKKGGPILGFD